ncbi:Rz1-like lysis system protein LysC [Klebsiella pneumoniae]|uniref:Rz1-like lysis system protein LysC n=1 Tax=Klebsiella pneumoniae TaxID=573 RepID=UPI003F6989F5
MRYLHQVGSVVRISADLTADTPIPRMDVPFTWQASLELNAKLYSALGQCNLDKAAIRKIEESRLGRSESGSKGSR